MRTDLPPVTQALLIANVVVFGLQQFFDEAMLIHFALWPLGSRAIPGGSVGFEVWQLVSRVITCSG